MASGLAAVIRGRAGALAAMMGVLLAVALPAPAAFADDVRARQWHLDSLKATEVQRLATGRGVVVAVIDSGVQADHPDLAGQLVAGTDITGAGTNGTVDDKNHGTGVAGLIAARGGGPGHALGLAPGAKIMPIRISLDLGPNDAPQAIRWAVDHGATVINLSIGTETAGDKEVEAVRYAFAHDVVVVAAAGNAIEGATGVEAPASIPGVLAVSAVDRTGAFWSGGVRGPQIAIAAPGVDIETLASHFASGRPGGYIQVPGGTSAAAPLVAAAAALIRSRYPRMHAPDVVNRLIRTADDAGPPGRDPEYGFGRLNVLRALTADVPAVATNPLLPAASATRRATGGVAGTDSGRLPVGLLLATGLVLLVLVVVVALIVAVRRSRRRSRRPVPSSVHPGPRQGFQGPGQGYRGPDQGLRR